MKTPCFSALPLLLAGLVLCGSGLAPVAHAQPEMPAKPKRAKKAAAAPKADGMKKPRAKNLMPRMVTATEAATGKPLTPAVKDQLTTALRAREAAVQAANEAYYAAFAQATGLTLEQVQEIDKLTRKTAAKPVTEPKTETTTNMDELTTDNDGETAPVSPK